MTGDRPNRCYNVSIRVREADSLAVQSQRMTVEEFDQFVAQPENADRLFEYIGGGDRDSLESTCISYRLPAGHPSSALYLLQNQVDGVATGADGDYVIAGEPTSSICIRLRSVPKRSIRLCLLPHSARSVRRGALTV